MAQSGFSEPKVLKIVSALASRTRERAAAKRIDPDLDQQEVLMKSELYLCAMCKVREVCVKGIDRSSPAVAYINPVDKLTSTVSWPTILGKHCYFCDKKQNGLIRL